MHKIRYRDMAVNRPIIVNRGIEGEIEVNATHGFVGEWVVFRLPMNETYAELRMPLDLAMEDGIVIAADKIFHPEELED